jgi:hypothetical protein
MGKLHLSIESNAKQGRGNLVDLPDPFFDMASAHVQLNQFTKAVDRLLDGIEINVHIPRLLLKPPRRASTEKHVAVDSEAWARDYAHGHLDLWPEVSLTFLKQVWKDRQLQDVLRAFASCQQAVDEATGEERTAALSVLRQFRENLFSRAWRREFKQRVVGSRP